VHHPLQAGHDSASKRASRPKNSNTCPRCRELSERGLGVLVCPRCFKARPGVRVSTAFIARRLLARREREDRQRMKGSG
jgi:hypothetical protein